MRSTLYAETSRSSTGDLVARHSELVKRIAYHLLGRLPPSVQIEDLIQAGMVALIEAAQKFDATKGASFETYVGIRIRGAMIDEVRKGDWTPRSVHRNARAISEAILSLENRLGREAKESEIAAELGIGLASYHAMLKDQSSAKLQSFEALLSESDDEDEAELNLAGFHGGPQQLIEREHFVSALAKAMTQLSQREQLVLSLYYDEELNLKEIAAVLGVTESRVSQIITQAALRLRARLESWKSA